LNRKKIYLVRHGQTDFNLKGVVQGSGIDAPINDNGRNQALAFYEAYKNIPFDQAYYTGLQRTKQSIQPFLDLGIPAVSTTDLNEISWGDYEGLPMTHEENQYYLHMLDQWRQGNLDYSIAGGESPNIVAKRMQRGIDMILTGPGETVLVCMHGRAMRIFLSLIMKEELRHMDNFEHKNLCLYLLQEKEDGVFELLKRNDTVHLMELK
jgi:probable phosphoglycerate mutase